MSGITEHGIRYPDSASRANQLGPELKRMADDLDTYIWDHAGPIAEEIVDQAVVAAIASNTTVRDAALAALNDGLILTSLGGSVDLNTLTSPQRKLLLVSTELSSPNLPKAVRMVLTVDASSDGNYVKQQAEFLQEAAAWWRVRYAGTWSPWYDVSVTNATTLAATDWNTLTKPGEFVVVAGAAISGSTNLPVAGQRLALTVSGAADGSYIVQRATSLVDGRVYTRARNANAWGQWVAAATAADVAAPTAAAAAGITNDLLVQDWTRRRGGRRRVQVGAVALRFDHGLAKFDSSVRPLLEARDLPYSLALCSAQWTAAENSGVTAAMVDGWVQAGLCEVWNHGRTHAGSESQAGWEAEIGTGLSELRAQIPSAQIDGFAVPGTAGVGYGDFDAGSTIAEFYGTPAGRYILSTHAVSSGYIPGTGRRVLDGRVRHGMAHSTLDAMSLATAQSEIAQSQTDKTGLQLMMHPSLLDEPGQITLATLTQILDHIVAERNAGRLIVCGPYDLTLADAT